MYARYLSGYKDHVVGALGQVSAQKTFYPSSQITFSNTILVPDQHIVGGLELAVLAPHRDPSSP